MFELTQDQRRVCDEFEAMCRELCTGRMSSIEGGFIRSGELVTGGVQDGVKVYWPDGYKHRLADRLELSIQYMQEEHASKTPDQQRMERLKSIEEESRRLRNELEIKNA